MINIIAWISVLAIGVGTSALIIVLSVFNGFEDLVKNLYGDFYSDISITAAKGKFVTIPFEQREKISKMGGVNRIAYFTEERAVLVNGDYQSIVNLKGVDENYGSVSKIAAHVERGEFRLGNTDTP
ncbi:MAG TPA: ABC transporter permease, partial [Chitinophagaceae bacterium]|nr:ABC transporter permease [Chitinophagaceae bacterium]